MDWRNRLAIKVAKPDEVVAYRLEDKSVVPAHEFNKYLTQCKDQGAEPEAHTPLTRLFCELNNIKYALPINGEVTMREVPEKPAGES